ncbi:Dihydroorotase [Bathymodiolus thermophilus thioautotrophic gill symbiont]|jgi:dihydroorotase|uniref:Dihydroorotase n=2 Tax=Bathymodiolus thermophilus thioautotrophic gill symbiont TaxID=2360 RepID=A0A8H9CGJ3_9GAMM|nr:dihydroorotase [Bathymodiolus thermophilus thioautotrophic gill symbiont]CAB5495078.1 Dihydroorotase (EC [Bathymodiolus thermophilus thioautotrophic gill symbiont]CAB5500005.1 Dihydroorotase (EC [Bathymodiolus thermophilus thioautotrophic gill symbiont]SHA11091.1 Dihydroorotase [Bathymodiolus thermophilus thioautotrophic gill symbiont]
MQKHITQITLIKPDDWHLHVRSGAALKSIVGMTAAQMGRAIIMPNLNPPVSNATQAHAYRQEILSALPKDSEFNPLMVLYLTDNTTPKDIQEALDNNVVAAKLYPAGATTNSDNGVTNITKLYPTLAYMQKLGMPLLLHGEVTRSDVDIFDREAVFIDEILSQVVHDFPELKIVFEHITTKEAVDFVLASHDKIAATITPHHLLANRNDMLVGGIKPHYFCLPILKRKNPHQSALLAAATSGNAKFFLGTDSAPHATTDKESACGCAGIFTAHCAIELYATVFERQNALHKLENFASKFGADFYNLPHNTQTITLHKQDWVIPANYPFANSTIVPFMATKTLSWKQLD